MAVKELPMAISMNALIEQVRIQYLNCSPPTEQSNTKRCFVVADRWTALVRRERAHTHNSYSGERAMAQITQTILLFGRVFFFCSGREKMNRKTK